MHNNIEIIRKNLCLNKLDKIVTLFNTGLGTKDQTCWVSSGDVNVGNGHVSCKPNPPNLTHAPLRNKVEVSMLDDFIDFENKDFPQIGSLKMDIEGYEYFAIQGGERFFQEKPPIFIIMEFIQGNQVEIIEFLYDKGYKFCLNSRCGLIEEHAKKINRTDFQSLSEVQFVHSKFLEVEKIPFRKH